MYTCLSGFIDQCEGIEEAVRREVMEEARVAVSGEMTGGRRLGLEGCKNGSVCDVSRGRTRQMAEPTLLPKTLFLTQVSEVHLLGTQPWPIGRYGWVEFRGSGTCVFAAGGPLRLQS
jgi:hypothetical protein